MSGLQGESTLTDAEKYTEAKRHVEALANSAEQMSAVEVKFIEDMWDRFERYGEKAQVSNKQLFWLRDLIAKY